MTFRPAPKPNHGRRKPKQKNVTRITQKVRDEVLNRSGGKCECCGKANAYAFETAHLINASHGGRGGDPKNVALLCGPSVNSGTCHHFADYTADGREWRMRKREDLRFYYEQQNQ